MANNVVTARNFVNTTAPVHILQGALGQEEGHDAVGNRPDPAWARSNNGADWGTSTITLHDAHTLTWSFRRASDGKELDTFTMTTRLPPA